MNWSEALRTDATAFRDLIQESHPGPHDSENPAFPGLLAREYARAMQRAQTATTYAHYFWALQEFANGFDDGHLGIKPETPKNWVWRSEWPGFATGLKDGTHRVVVAEAADGPPLGAVLIACDGVPADALMAERVGAAHGRWNLSSQRTRYSPRLFMRSDNPYRPRVGSCDFRFDGAVQTYALNWTPSTVEQRRAAAKAAAGKRFFAPVDLSSFAGGVWISLGSFEGDPGSVKGRELTALQTEIKARAEDIRRAPIVVFDLRGNDGGSSAWSRRIAETLWGEALVAAKTPQSEAVDWRVSDGNIAHMQFLRELFSQPESADPTLLVWVNEVLTGLTAAKVQGRAFWRQTSSSESDAPNTVAGDSLMPGRVYVLTDNGCASACLDAVDLFTSLGAKQVGQETSADSLYLEVREEALPSGWSIAVVPIKVYRGRARGSNVPASPAYPWTGEMDDTAAIRSWITTLESSHQPSN